VKSLEIVAHCHATEEPERVRQALLNVLPPPIRDAVKIEEEHLEGYYHNPILRMRIAIGEDLALSVLKYIVCQLSDSDRRYLELTLEQRYDRKSNRLFVRLDKQEAYLGSLTLNDGSDTIRVAISFSIARSLEEVRKLIEALCREDHDSSDRSAAPNT